MSWIRFLATGFGAGRAPVAPGTFGTLVALPLIYAVSMLPPVWGLVLSAILVFGAVVVAELYERQSGQHDQSEVVIDEVVGYLVAMTWLPTRPLFLLAGFVLFRVFDIWKPYPIRAIDERIKGGLGVVMDDIAAGLLTNFILQIIYLRTHWLGEQWPNL